MEDIAQPMLKFYLNHVSGYAKQLFDKLKKVHSRVTDYYVHSVKSQKSHGNIHTTYLNKICTNVSLMQFVKCRWSTVLFCDYVFRSFTTALNWTFNLIFKLLAFLQFSNLTWPCYQGLDLLYSQHELAYRYWLACIAHTY